MKRAVGDFASFSDERLFGELAEGIPLIEENAVGLDETARRLHQEEEYRVSEVIRGFAEEEAAKVPGLGSHSRVRGRRSGQGPDSHRPGAVPIRLGTKSGDRETLLRPYRETDLCDDVLVPEDRIVQGTLRAGGEGVTPLLPGRTELGRLDLSEFDRRGERAKPVRRLRAGHHRSDGRLSLESSACVPVQSPAIQIP